MRHLVHTPNAEATATAILRTLRKMVAEGDAPPVIRLHLYPTTNDFRMLATERSLTHAQHCEHVQNVVALIRAEGFEATAVPCTALEYLSWLDQQGLSCNNHNRAVFLARKAG